MSCFRTHRDILRLRCSSWGFRSTTAGTHSSRAPPASSGQWSLYVFTFDNLLVVGSRRGVYRIRGQNLSSYSPEIPPFALGTHHARQFSHQEGSQYAELRSESPPSSWIRGQDPLQHQPLSQSQKWEAFSGFKDYPRSLSPPMQHSATYDPPLPSAPSITYPSNNDHGRRHPGNTSLSPSPRRHSAKSLLSGQPRTAIHMGLPPLRIPLSGPASTSHSGSGTQTELGVCVWHTCTLQRQDRARRGSSSVSRGTVRPPPVASQS